MIKVDDEFVVSYVAMADVRSREETMRLEQHTSELEARTRAFASSARHAAKLADARALDTFP